MVLPLSALRCRARMRWNSRSKRHTFVGLLTILVGALLMTACGGGSESRATVVAVDLVAGTGEVTYVVGSAPPDTVRVPMPCAQEVAVGEPIPACVQEALAAAFAAEVAMADGPRIAFVSMLDGSYQIYTTRADGTDVRQVTAHTGFWPTIAGPAWSPDGTRIAFESRLGIDGSVIYTMRSDGTDVRQVTLDRLFPGDPDWSPSGTRIAFSSGNTR